MKDRDVADQLAIRNLYAAYTYFVDDHDADGFADCFTPDAEIELSGFRAVLDLVASGQAPFLNEKRRAVGTANIKALCRMVPGHVLALHLTGNVWIKRLDGDEAEGIATFCVFGDDGTVEHYGRYVDKLARCTDGRWRFMERRDVGRYERDRPAFGGLQDGSAST